MTATEFAERRLLPLLLAFACGALLMDISHASRTGAALDMTDRAITVAEAYRAQCGEVWDAGRPLIATVTEPQQ